MARSRRFRTLITTATLRTQSWKDLADMARNKGLSGWRSMRKDDLVKALLRAAKKRSRAREQALATAKPSKPKTLRTASANKTQLAKPQQLVKTQLVKTQLAKPQLAKPQLAKTPLVKTQLVKAHSAHLNGSSASAKTNGSALPAKRTAKQIRISERIHRESATRERLKDLSGSFSLGKEGNKKRHTEKDRLVLMVRDPYWLHAVWNVTRLSVRRAEAALAEHWHTAFPVLRLLEVDGGHTTSTAERISREIDVHGGVTNWYIEVSTPPQSFRVELGYRSANGKFFSICRSNIVNTPAPDSSDVIDGNWKDVAENYERVYALSGGYTEDKQGGELQELFEERLRRPMGNGGNSQFGSGAERVLNRHRDLDFHVDAEMILYGRTKPDAKVTLGGEPIKLRPDGSFTVRQPLPDKRQVLPVVASSPDGVEQRTIVIAVERNTKILEPMVRESNE